MRKRTVTTIEIAELIVVSTAHTEIPRPPCPVCSGPMMVTPEEAAALARGTVRSIYARVEVGSVHFLEKPDGLLLVCAKSMSQLARERFADDSHDESRNSNTEVMHLKDLSDYAKDG